MTPTVATAVGRRPARLVVRGRAARPRWRRSTVPLADADGLTLADAADHAAPTCPRSRPPVWTAAPSAARRRGASSARSSPAASPAPLTDDGTAVEIATGAMVPAGRRRDHPGRGVHRRRRRPGHRRRPRDAGVAATRRGGEQAARSCCPPARRSTRACIGLAAACGYDTLPVPPGAARRAAWSSATSCSPPGPPGAGRVRDSLGPQRARLAAPATAADGRARPTSSARSRTPSTRTSTAIRAALERRRPGLHHRRHDARPGRPPAPGAGRARRRVRGQHRRGPPRLPDAAGPGDRRRTGGPGSSPGCPATRSPPWSRWSRWSRRCSPGCAGRPVPALPPGRRWATPVPGPRRLHPPGAGPRRPADGLGLPGARTSARRCCAGWPAPHGFAVIAPGTAGAAGRPGAVRAAAAAARRATVTVTVDDVTDQPLDLAAHEAAVADPRAGAVVSFQGVVRDHDHGRARDPARLRGPPQRGRRAARGRRGDRRRTRTSTRWPSRTGSARWRSATWRWSPRSAPPTGRRPSPPAPAWSTRSKARLPIWKHQVFTDGTDEWVNCP